MPDKRVVIVGGGLAGLAAAISALEQGWKPLLLERTAHLGGRARSLFAQDVGQYIDNGQHVLAASYRETRRLLTQIGSADKVYFQKRLTIQYQLSSRREFLLRSWPLAAPFHFLLPLLLQSPLTRPDRRSLFRWARGYLLRSPETLRHLTVREWLKEFGETPFLEKFLWEPLTLATLNTPVDQASAYLLYQVLKNAFLSSARVSGLGIPQAMLSEIFAHPAEAYLGRHGGEIRTNATVKRLIVENDTVSALETAGGDRLATPRLILAVPPLGLARLLQASPPLPERLSLAPDRFEHSPIITINLWVRRPLPGRFPMSLIDSPLQWIFPLPGEAQRENLCGYALVISAAREQVSLDSEELLRMVDSEFRHFFQKDLRQGFQLVAHKVVKEKFATFLQTPQALRLRPGSQTPIRNLFLAGDWTDTDLPATIESAVLSGRLAVERMRETPPG